MTRRSLEDILRDGESPTTPDLLSEARHLIARCMIELRHDPESDPHKLGATAARMITAINTITSLERDAGSDLRGMSDEQLRAHLAQLMAGLDA
jgi:hypothetical protein